MCGLAGLLAVSSAALGSAGELVQWLGGMSSALAHRGPDDHGLWHDPEVPVALASRRLAIVDP